MREPPMEEGKSMKTSVEDEWAGAVWGRTGCSGDESSGTLACQTGSCRSPSGEDVQCSLGPPADTIVAMFNLLSPTSTVTDSYYVSLVTGFNLPMTLVPVGSSSNNKDECPEVSCPVDLNDGCPAELQVPSSHDNGSTIACRGPCSSNTTYQSCCARAANGDYPPQGCTLSGNWFYFARSCRRARTYPSDVTIGNDGVCNSSTGYTITFCPSNIGKSTSTVLWKLADILESRSFQEGWVSVFLLLTILASILLLLGFLRKSTSNEIFLCFMWAAYYSIPSVISYGLSHLTQGEGSKARIYAIYGLFLLTVLGSCGSISAFSLEDNDSAMRLLLELMINSFLVGGLIGQMGSWLYILPLLAFGAVMLRRIVERGASLNYASKNKPSDGVAQAVRIIADHMANDIQRSTAATEEADDPLTMTGYRYLVGLREAMSFFYNAGPPSYRYKILDGDDKITTETIWHCQGELLRSNEPGDRLKDICLSFSLFWLLLRRYAGYALVEIKSEEARKKTWKFVRDGLMPKDIKTSRDEGYYERPFRVIETELSFMYDFFFTKNFRVYCKGLWTKLFHLLVTLGLYLYVTQYVLPHYEPPPDSIRLGRAAAEVLATKIVLYLVIASDVVQFTTIVLISDWYKVAWVCHYVRKKLWESNGYDRIVIEKLCTLSLKISPKPWKREVGQYSLFKSHYCGSLKRCMILCLSSAIIDPGKNLKGGKPIPLSPKVKRAVLFSLQENEGRVTNGIFSLKRNRVVRDGEENEFSKVLQLETQTHVILVWHVATSYCEMIKKSDNANSNSDDSLLVATTLSGYCAYLVAFTPELLPDPPNITKVILETVNNEEVSPLFEGCSTLESKREKISGYQLVPGVEDKILHQGIKLGKSLIENRGNDVWKILAEFWAEYILYLAPSDNIAAHIKRLANGGEFITHLWALLTHAGIIQRNQTD